VTTRSGPPPRRVVAVLPDVTGIDREFAYAVPDPLAASVELGSIVRVPLHGRKVRGWVVAEAGEPDGYELREILALVSAGPAPEIVGLGRFGAWRYAGRLRPFLLAGSPPRLVGALPPGRPPGPPGPEPGTSAVAEATRRALQSGSAVLRLPPAAPRLDVVMTALAAAGDRDALVLVPARRDAEVLAKRLARLGRRVALQPEAWAEAAAGGCPIVGARAAAFAPVARLGVVVVLDAHSESYVEQRAPTWDATVLAAERAHRAGVPCLQVSPCPTLASLVGSALVTLDPGSEQAGWAAVEVIDRCGDDPRSGLFSARFAAVVRDWRRSRPELPVVCVLNRTGRARLLACGACRAIVRCERCGAALVELGGDIASLHCSVCGSSRPFVCATCSSTRLRRLRLGTARAAEEIAALVGEPVEEVSSGAPPPATGAAGVLVGTEAVLHRVRAASAVVFLDFDQELLAPRFRAGEEALALLALASRLVGGRGPAAGGRPRGPVAIQTRIPDHEVVRAAVAGDPGLCSGAEATRRRALDLPPYSALAVVSGPGAEECARRLGAAPAHLEVAQLGPDRFWVRAPNPFLLADELAGAGLPTEGVRVEVDPVRL
jgi:primosomal protein N' (replication factor Y)